MAEGELLLLLAAHLILTALPGVAAVLFAAARGEARVPVLLAIALAASGVVAMLSFWSYWGSRELGETFAYFTVLGSVLLIAVTLWGRRIEGALLRALSTPLLLWVLGSVFLVFLGFLHGGEDGSITMASTRFSGQLPSDNDIPNFFTEWFFLNGGDPRPPVYGDGWLFSDRPPLQVGYMLSQRGFGWDDDGLNYQLLGVVVQQLWIVAVWALLLAARVGRLTRALVMGTVLVSGLAILNGFFVWPKMLPAAMLIAAAALVMTPLWPELRRSLWGAGLVAVLLALAMLGHGSSVFGAIPIALIAIARGGLPSWRWVGVLLASGAVLMVPWMAYQKYEDPPGNRLTKWMIAGVDQIDPRGAREAIFDSYEEAGLGGAIDNKSENFAVMLGVGGMGGLNLPDNVVDAVGDGDAELTVRELRNLFFFHLLPSLGLLLLALPAMALGRRRGRERPEEWSFALRCLFVFAVGAVAWGLLLFGNLPSRTVVHAGTYMIPLVGICGAVAGLRAVLPRFATWWAAIAAVLSLALYVPSLDPLPGTSYSALAAVLAAAGLAGFLWALFREPVRAEASVASPVPAADG
jgi:hypothetical protein